MLTVACLLVSLALTFTTQPADAAPEPAVTIALAGDSTVTDDAGWGVGFAKCWRDDVKVLNFARGGRSSKSFRDEGHWADVLASKPDVVLIQFGHNDQPGKGPARETDPQTTYRANMERYVAEARDAGITPVLLTSLARRQWNDQGGLRSSLIPYVEVVRAVARELNVPFIELHDRSIEVYLSLGRAGCEAHISPVGENNKIDGTHLNAEGSLIFGPLVADELRRLLPEVAPHFRLVQRADAVQPERQTMEPQGELTHQGSRTIVVAADGSGDVRTVQDAIALAPANNADRVVIEIRPGVYVGQILIPRNKPNLTLRGTDVQTCILTYALNVYDPIPPGVPHKLNGNGVVVLGAGTHLENLTLRNTAGDRGQAMALRLQADRVVVRACRLLGWQDTLLAHSGRQYVVDSHIEGRVDFIYGGSTIVFERCEIKSKLGGYVTAASTPAEHPHGYVFLDCRFTSDDAVATYLGRPWRPHASVAVVRCDLGPHIRPEGWHNWGKPENELTARYTEHANTGAGADRSARVPWSRTLTDAEAASLTPKAILAGEDGWNPAE